MGQSGCGKTALTEALLTEGTVFQGPSRPSRPQRPLRHRLQESSQQVGIMPFTFASVSRRFVRLFDECTQRPLRYIMIALHPASDDRFRLFSNVTAQDGPTVVYERL